MKKTLKKYFIPHRGNNFHPHILHTKRACMYGGLFVAMKIIVVGLAVMLPLEVFVMPDVLAAEQKQVIILTNHLRAQLDLPTFKEVKPLNISADKKAEDMVKNEYFDHTGPHGRNLDYFLQKAGYDYLSAGENLAMGFSSAEEILAAWEKSPTHYANLVDPEFKDFGVGLESGYYQGIPTVYVAQHFGLADNLATAPAQTKEIAKEENKIITSETEQPTSTPIIKQVAGLNIQQNTKQEEPIKNEPSQKVTITDAGVIKTGGPTPVEKYTVAKRSLGFLTNIFSLSKNIYLAFIVFFSLALLLKIFIEIKKQHPHVILQTLGLIGLLICFYLI